MFCHHYLECARAFASLYIIAMTITIPTIIIGYNNPDHGIEETVIIVTEINVTVSVAVVSDVTLLVDSMIIVVSKVS
jgi:hypothetical protein